MNMFLQFIVFRIRFYTVPGRVRIRCHQAKKSKKKPWFKKNLSTVLWILFEKKFFFAGVLKVTNPDPDWQHRWYTGAAAAAAAQACAVRPLLAGERGDEPGGGHDLHAGRVTWPGGRVGKNPGFYIKKKTSPVVFFGFFGFFWVFYVCAQKREFLGFFQFQEYFRCIQTLNYNQSY